MIAKPEGSFENQMKIGVMIVAADDSTQTKILIKVLPPGSIYYITIAFESMATIMGKVKALCKICKARGLIPEYFVRPGTTRSFLVCIYSRNLCCTKV